MPIRSDTGDPFGGGQVYECWANNNNLIHLRCPANDNADNPVLEDIVVVDIGAFKR